MLEEYPLELRQINQTRADFYAIADDLEFIKTQLAKLPTRAYFCRTLLLATTSIGLSSICT